MKPRAILAVIAFIALPFLIDRAAPQRVQRRLELTR
jgi:hypothetical protein